MAHGHKFAKLKFKYLAICQNFTPPKLPAIRYMYNKVMHRVRNRLLARDM